ncbi:hypothetical protein PoB_000004600 [Plakobranchus ocellatus]|uniref:Uncharacterized protein n=1 Tax=Plakobranchus ocellatus TaxID=259542 RepID=A0AAV3XTV5_9GAST|nr:hypothetical protein PoB_000004600 [Plakobranchus ocellatus]
MSANVCSTSKQVITEPHGGEAANMFGKIENTSNKLTVHAADKVWCPCQAKEAAPVRQKAPSDRERHRGDSPPSGRKPRWTKRGDVKVSQRGDSPPSGRKLRRTERGRVYFRQRGDSPPSGRKPRRAVSRSNGVTRHFKKAAMGPRRFEEE